MTSDCAMTSFFFFLSLFYFFAASAAFLAAYLSASSSSPKRSSEPNESYSLIVSCGFDLSVPVCFLNIKVYCFMIMAGGALEVEPLFAGLIAFLHNLIAPKTSRTA